MRKFKFFSLLMACLLIFASCSKSEHVSNVSSASKKPTSTASESTTSSPINERKIIAGTVAAMLYLDFLEVDCIGVVNTSMIKVPERYENTPTIGLSMSPNSEVVVSLEPDLYIGDELLRPTVEKIAQIDTSIEILYLSGSSYNSIAKDIEVLCQELNLEGKQEEVRKMMDKNIDEAKKIAGDKKPPTVAILFGSPDSFSLASDSSFTGDVLNIVGGVNILDELDVKTNYVNYDREKLAETDPDIILRLSHGGADRIEETNKAFNEAYKEPYWQGLSAVKNNKIYNLDPLMFGVTATMNSIDSPVEMANIIYGEE